MPRRRTPKCLPDPVWWELHGICRQYGYVVQKLNSYDSMGRSVIRDSPRGGKRNGSPVEKAAEGRERLRASFAILEESFREAWPESIREQMILSFTRDLNYDNLRMRHNLLISRLEYYQARNRFMRIWAAKTGKMI